jgi:D-alanyl-D-alanine carboxypeptidase
MEFNRRQVAALGPLGLLGSTLSSQGRAQPSLPAPVQALLARSLTAAGGSSGAVTIVRDGRLAGFWSHGFASMPFRVPITERTLFHVGSVGKHVTALLVLRQVESRRVQLDAPIGTYVQGLPRDWARVSVRHLLQHLSGIPDYTEVLTDWDRPQTKSIVIRAMSGAAAEFVPGQRHSYSNTNYLLLGWMLEAVSGRRYADLVAEQLFRPAGLPHARADAAQEPIADRAEPYEVEEGGVRHAVRMENALSAAADGGLLFAAADWAPWSAALESRRLISEASWQAMHTPARLNNGREAPYGFGWGIHRARGETFYSHSGSVPGFSTYVLRVPARKLTVVLTLNLAREGPDWDQLPAQVVAALHPGATYYGE